MTVPPRHSDLNCPIHPRFVSGNVALCGIEVLSKSRISLGDLARRLRIEATYPL
jgi:hypothetical protein